jgi:hypothetical protein
LVPFEEAAAQLAASVNAARARPFSDRRSSEERRKGQAKGAETRRARREHAAEEAAAQLAASVNAAVAKLIVLLDSHDETSSFARPASSS